jgi:LmbE family N-acetylglucosaminyl deacetylase
LLHDEFMVAMRILGIKPARMHVFTYPVRKLSYHRQEILEDLMRLRAKYEPELVLAPSRSDLHQDHQVLHAESLRAFKDGSIWGYELPWNNIEFAATAFVKIEERHLAKKWAALQAYQSQLTLGRLYFCKQFIDGLARVRGVQVKTPFAEAFDLTRIKI